MAATRKNIAPYSGVKVRGFARVQIWENPKARGKKKRLVGDSGWIENTFTAEGKNNYIAAKVGSATGSRTPTHFAIATQSTTVDSTQTALVGEHTVRVALTPSSVAVGTLRMTASWGSAQNDALKTVGSIGVHNTSTNGGATLGSGQTFTTSAWATNQDISATYEWRFA